MLKLVLISQFAIVLLFVTMTISNEIVDLPHYIFRDNPISMDQRKGEIVIELIIFAIIILIEAILLKYFYQRVRVLEGFLPICANCKKIRNEESWDQIEKYISDHSLAQFSHTICPDCKIKLYPDLFDKKTE